MTPFSIEDARKLVAAANAQQRFVDDTNRQIREAATNGKGWVDLDYTSHIQWKDISRNDIEGLPTNLKAQVLEHALPAAECLRLYPKYGYKVDYVIKIAPPRNADEREDGIWHQSFKVRISW